MNAEDHLFIDGLRKYVAEATEDERDAIMADCYERLFKIIDQFDNVHLATAIVAAANAGIDEYVIVNDDNEFQAVDNLEDGDLVIIGWDNNWRPRLIAEEWRAQ